MVAWDMADLMHMHALDGLPQHLPLRRYQLTVFLRARQHGHSPLETGCFDLPALEPYRLKPLRLKA